ncbi:unnamed protein product, partial [Laminaria digitata]
DDSTERKANHTTTSHASVSALPQKKYRGGRPCLLLKAAPSHAWRHRLESGIRYATFFRESHWIWVMPEGRPRIVRRHTIWNQRYKYSRVNACLECLEQYRLNHMRQHG